VLLFYAALEAAGPGLSISECPQTLTAEKQACQPTASHERGETSVRTSTSQLVSRTWPAAQLKAFTVKTATGKASSELTFLNGDLRIAFANSDLRLLFA
jgi:hypothetical protein